MHRWLLVALLAVSACDPAAPSDTGGEAPLPAVALPDDLERVLREYEQASAAGDTSALLALFTSDGLLLAPGAPPVRGEAALGRALASRAGPLRLVPVAYAAADSVGYIIGTFGSEESATAGGKSRCRSASE